MSPAPLIPSLLPASLHEVSSRPLNSCRYSNPSFSPLPTTPPPCVSPRSQGALGPQARPPTRGAAGCVLSPFLSHFSRRVVALSTGSRAPGAAASSWCHFAIRLLTCARHDGVVLCCRVLAEGPALGRRGRHRAGSVARSVHHAAACKRFEQPKRSKRPKSAGYPFCVPIALSSRLAVILAPCTMLPRAQQLKGLNGPCHPSFVPPPAASLSLPLIALPHRSPSPLFRVLFVCVLASVGTAASWPPHLLAGDPLCAEGHGACARLRCSLMNGAARS